MIRNIIPKREETAGVHSAPVTWHLVEPGLKVTTQAPRYHVIDLHMVPGPLDAAVVHIAFCIRHAVDGD
jgi:hypothetical protein